MPLKTPLALKEEILLASCQAGAVISAVAKSYGMPAQRLYHWRRKLAVGSKRQCRPSKAGGSFIELVPEVDRENGLGEIAIKACILLPQGSIRIEGKFDVGQLRLLLDGVRAAC